MPGRWLAGVSSKQKAILLAASAANALFFFDQTSVTTALPSIQRDLDASATQAQWVIAAYLLPLAALMAASGRLGDLWGRRRLFVGGIVLFGLASLVCALAPDASVLIAARAVQGVGAAISTPLGTAAVASGFPSERRGWAIGVLATGGTIFLAVGPVAGGLVTEAGSWRWVFLVNLPVVALSAVAGMRSFDTGRKAAGARVDWLGLVLLTCGLSALVVVLLEAVSWGGTDARTIGGGALALVLLGAFVRVEHRAREPLVDLRLLRRPRVGASLAALGAIQFAILGVTVYILPYLQHVLGYGPVIAGLLFLPSVLATPLLSPRTGRLADRRGPRLPVAGGMAIAAAGLVWIALVVEHRDVVLLVCGLALFGVSRPLVITPSSTAAIGAVGEELRGLAAGLVTCSRQVGAVLGTAVVGAVVGIVEVDRRHEHLPSVAPTLSRADRGALDGLMTGSESGDRVLQLVPPGVERTVVRIVQDAFSSGLSVAFLVTAGLAAATALATWLALRPGAALPGRKAAASPRRSDT